MNLRNQASAIHEVPPPKSFTFLHDACRALEQARKVVAVGEAKERYAKGAEWAWMKESEEMEVELPGTQAGCTDLTGSPLGAGLRLCLQLLQPGHRVHGCGGAADREPGAAHKCPADPPR